MVVVELVTERYDLKNSKAYLLENDYTYVIILSPKDKIDNANSFYKNINDISSYSKKILWERSSNLDSSNVWNETINEDTEWVEIKNMIQTNNIEYRDRSKIDLHNLSFDIFLVILTDHTLDIKLDKVGHKEVSKIDFRNHYPTMVIKGSEMHWKIRQALQEHQKRNFGQKFLIRNSQEWFLLWNKDITSIICSNLVLPENDGVSTWNGCTDKEYRRIGLYSQLRKMILEKYKVCNVYLELERQNSHLISYHSKFGFEVDPNTTGEFIRMKRLTHNDSTKE